MKKELFAGVECVAVKIVYGSVSLQDLNIIEVSGDNTTFARPLGNGEFRLITEDEMALEALEKGRGVYAKGTVYFLESIIEGNHEFARFTKALRHYENGLTPLERYLYDSVWEILHFPMVKSMISLYYNGVFSKEMVLKKLESYLPMNKAIIVLNSIDKKKEAV